MTRRYHIVTEDRVVVRREWTVATPETEDEPTTDDEVRSLLQRAATRKGWLLRNERQGIDQRERLIIAFAEEE